LMYVKEDLIIPHVRTFLSPYYSLFLFSFYLSPLVAYHVYKGYVFYELTIVQ